MDWEEQFYPLDGGICMDWVDDVWQAPQYLVQVHAYLVQLQSPQGESSNLVDKKLRWAQTISSIPAHAHPNPAAAEQSHATATVMPSEPILLSHYQLNKTAIPLPASNAQTRWPLPKHPGSCGIDTWHSGIPECHASILHGPGHGGNDHLYPLLLGWQWHGSQF